MVGQDEKYRRVIIDIIPCVVFTSLEADAFVAFVANVDMLMVRSNLSARSRKEGTQGSVAILKEKRVQGCVSQDSDPRNSIPRKVEELGLNASAGHTRKCSGCTWYKIEFRKERQSGGIVQEGEHHERNPCAPGFEEQPPEETSRRAGCTSKVAWNLARNYASSSRTSNYVWFSCEGAKDTEALMFIVYSEAFSAQC